MYKDGDKCPICGKGILSRQLVNETFEYNDSYLEIPDYEIFKCSKCDEEVVSKKTMKETEKVIRDFHRTVDGLLTSQQIRRIRKSLGFTQSDLGNLLGGGEKSFARYENGTLTQSKAMDNLLRIIEKYPYTIDALTPMPAIVYASDMQKYNTKEENKYNYQKASGF